MAEDIIRSLFAGARVKVAEMMGRPIPDYDDQFKGVGMKCPKCGTTTWQGNFRRSDRSFALICDLCFELERETGEKT